MSKQQFMTRSIHDIEANENIERIELRGIEDSNETDLTANFSVSIDELLTD